MTETAQFLNILADEAGTVVRRYFRQSFALETKSRHDPVTEADRGVETALRRLIGERFPDDGIQGEEFGITPGTSGRVWVIDPIDGTRAFAIGRPTFATLIALCEDGKAVAGLIDQPIVGDRWIGVKGRPTTYNGRPCRTRPCTDPGQAALISTSPDMFGAEDELRFSRALIEPSRFTAWGGDCYAYGLLASGFADAVIEAGLKAHDIMPVVPVIEGAGGIITDWQGRPFTLESSDIGQTLACGDPVLHRRLLELAA